MDINKKIFIFTNGCPENRIDGARVEKFLKENSYQITYNFLEADVIIFNACKTIGSIDIIKDLKKNKKPLTELIVYGCFPKIHKEELNNLYQGVSFGSDEVEYFNEIFKPTKIQAQDVYANYVLPRVSSLKHKKHLFHKGIPEPKQIIPKIKRKIERKTIDKKYRQIQETVSVFHYNSFLIKVSTGCLNACSFCATHFARGKVKSKAIDNVVSEFQEGLSKGYSEFGLIGTDLGSYGRDLGTNLAELLENLLRKEGDYQIRLRNIQPRFLIEMMPMLIDIFKTGKIPNLESAVQSGNNRILKLMRRGHNIEDYKKAMQTIKKEVPDLKIRTQMIVGFPSETEEEFQDTVRLLDKIEFNYVEVYGFVVYPNTDASMMKDKLPKEVIEKRYHELYMKAASKWTSAS